MHRRRIRGIKLGRKLVRVFRWAAFFRRKATTRYQQLGSSCYDNEDSKKNNSRATISRLCKWGRSIRRGAKEICSNLNSPRSSHPSTPTAAANRILNSDYSSYIRLSHSPRFDDDDDDDYEDYVNGSPISGGGSWRMRRKRIGGVPKGHLAVYVGEEEKHRVLVPVIYLNHPLFEKLLKEAEEAYGFDQPGKITIPCPISEFEHVQTEIAERDYSRRRRKLHLNNHSDVGGLRCFTI